MKSRKHSKLKRHPIVRFIRGIFRLFRVISRPKKSLYRAAEYHQNFTEESLELEPTPESLDLTARHRANSITVEELFLQVKWQLSQPAEPAEPVTKIQADDVSRN
jgi:hypothetical protein